MATNAGQVEGGAVQLLPHAKHNDFMNFGNANFEAMIRKIAGFALSQGAKAKL